MFEAKSSSVDFSPKGIQKEKVKAGDPWFVLVQILSKLDYLEKKLSGFVQPSKKPVKAAAKLDKAVTLFTKFSRPTHRGFEKLFTAANILHYIMLSKVWKKRQKNANQMADIALRAEECYKKFGYFDTRRIMRIRKGESRSTYGQSLANMVRLAKAGKFKLKKA
jgi:hypothetical protein